MGKKALCASFKELTLQHRFWKKIMSIGKTISKKSSTPLKSLSLLLMIAAIVPGALSVLLLQCKSTPTGPAAPTPLDSLSFARVWLNNSAISPWKQDTVALYRGKELYGGIDGGAGSYLDQGLLQTAIQQLSKGTLTCEVRVMDFGISANATAMFDIMRAKAVTKKYFTTFSDSVAMLDDAPLAGNTTYAHFDRFFYQLAPWNYGDKAAAIEDAEKFVTIVDSIVKAYLAHP
jgi:hypothetical protein